MKIMTMGRNPFGKSVAMRELAKKLREQGHDIVFEATPENVKRRPREPMFTDVVFDEEAVIPEDVWQKLRAVGLK